MAELTRREREVATHIAEGLTDREIAGRLGVSMRTVEAHVQHMLNKLGYQRRAQIAAWISRPDIHRIQGNLPSTIEPCIGRDAEMATVCDLLLRKRLVTLVGPGGVGKTRLAIDSARRAAPDFPDGVWVVSLLPTSDPDLILEAIERTLGIRDAATHYLVNRRALLVLDNFDHLVDGAAVVEALIAACGRLSILVTSRIQLGLATEQRLHVPPLDSVAAMALFTARASSALPSFDERHNSEAVTAICDRLDRLPLAIELAAPWVAVLTIDELLRRLNPVLPLLVQGGASPPQHRTMRQAIQWSYDRLSQADQQVFRGLSICRGGWDLEAAEALCGREVFAQLKSLVDWSLVQHGDGRYSMLETIREFGREQVDALGEGREQYERHAEHYASLTRRAAPLLKSPRAGEWLRRLEDDEQNILAAAEFLLQHDRVKQVIELGHDLYWFWFMRGRVAEGKRLMERAQLSSRLSDIDRAVAQSVAGGLLFPSGRYSESSEVLDASIHVLRSAQRSRELALALLARAFVAVYESEPDRALVAAREAIEYGLHTETDWIVGLARTATAAALLENGDLRAAERAVADAVPHLERAGSPWDLAVCRIIVGGQLLGAGVFRGAALAFGDALRLMHSIGDSWTITNPLMGMSVVAAELHRDAEAALLLGAVQAQGERLGATLIPPAQRLFARRTEELVLSRSDRTAFEADLARGRLLTISEAVVLAGAISQDISE